jgi:hypothetical protein
MREDLHKGFKYNKMQPNLAQNNPSISTFNYNCLCHYIKTKFKIQPSERNIFLYKGLQYLCLRYLAQEREEIVYVRVNM